MKHIAICGGILTGMGEKTCDSCQGRGGGVCLGFMNGGQPSNLVEAVRDCFDRLPQCLDSEKELMKLFAKNVEAEVRQAQELHEADERIKKLSKDVMRMQAEVSYWREFYPKGWVIIREGTLQSEDYIWRKETGHYAPAPFGSAGYDAALYVSIIRPSREKSRA